MALTIQGITLTYMQDFATLSYANWHKVVDNMVIEQAYTLIDKRDNNEYKIAKLKDGKVWMCQNLRLVNFTCTPEDSDIISGTFKVLASDISKFKSEDDNNDAVYYAGNTDDGAYYTWHTATAGTGTASMSSGNATSSICPKGWKLPKGGAAGSATSDFVTLVKAYGGTGYNVTDATTIDKIMASPAPHFTYAGYVYYGTGALNNRGSYGNYWSRTAYNTTYAYNLDFSSNGLLTPADNSTKRYGLSVRGILREPPKPTPTAKLYGSRGTKATQLSKVYLPVDGKAKQINKIYGSVNGQTRLIFNHFTAPLIETLTYMQDCANYSLTQLKEGMVMEKPYTLIDKRDNTPYKIALLKDGNIAMAEEFKGKGFTCHPDDSNVSEDYTLPQSSLANFHDDTPALYENNEGYVFYNTYCALADGKGDIAPLGWELPPQTYWNDFIAKNTNYFESPINIVRKGMVKAGLAGGVYTYPWHNSSQTESDGIYWSSTPHPTNNEIQLGLWVKGSNNTLSAGGSYSNKNYGALLRFIVKRKKEE